MAVVVVLLLLAAGVGLGVVWWRRRSRKEQHEDMVVSVCDNPAYIKPTPGDTDGVVASPLGTAAAAERELPAEPSRVVTNDTYGELDPGWQQTTERLEAPPPTAHEAPPVAVDGLAPASPKPPVPLVEAPGPELEAPGPAPVPVAREPEPEQEPVAREPEQEQEPVAREPEPEPEPEPQQVAVEEPAPLSAAPLEPAEPEVLDAQLAADIDSAPPSPFMEPDAQLVPSGPTAEQLALQSRVEAAMQRAEARASSVSPEKPPEPAANPAAPAAVPVPLASPPTRLPTLQTELPAFPGAQEAEEAEPDYSGMSAVQKVIAKARWSLQAAKKSQADVGYRAARISPPPTHTHIHHHNHHHHHHRHHHQPLPFSPPFLPFVCLCQQCSASVFVSACGSTRELTQRMRIRLFLALLPPAATHNCWQRSQGAG